MIPTIIEGKRVGESFKLRLKEIIASQKRKPGLATILVGDDPASQIYINKKIKACEELGIHSEHHKFSADTKESDLLRLIHNLNESPDIHGILVQVPLPKGINTNKVINAISPSKDVDCFHPFNIGSFLAAKTWEEMKSLTFLPCTPYGIMELFEYYDIDIAGKEACVIGRSNIVGKPIGMMMLAKNATVTYCHSKTKDLAQVVRRADIVVAAIGKAKFITKEFIKEGAVVIDVGSNRTDKGLCGDVDFEAVRQQASFITPVPGGVGPMTITMLMRNTVQAALRK